MKALQECNPTFAVAIQKSGRLWSRPLFCYRMPKTDKRKRQIKPRLYRRDFIWRLRFMLVVLRLMGFRQSAVFMVLGFKGFMFSSVRRTPADRKAGLKRSRQQAVSPGVWGLATNKQNPWRVTDSACLRFRLSENLRIYGQSSRFDVSSTKKILLLLFAWTYTIII